MYILKYSPYPKIEKVFMLVCYKTNPFFLYPLVKYTSSSLVSVKPPQKIWILQHQSTTFFARKKRDNILRRLQAALLKYLWRVSYLMLLQLSILVISNFPYGLTCKVYMLKQLNCLAYNKKWFVYINSKLISWVFRSLLFLSLYFG